MYAFNKRARLPVSKSGVPYYSMLCFVLGLAPLFFIVSLESTLLRIVLIALSILFFIAGLAVHVYKEKLLYWKLYLYGRRDRRWVNTEIR